MVFRIGVVTEITQINCGQRPWVQTFRPGLKGAYRDTPISLTMGDCTRLGEILVLKNLLGDLRVAANETSAAVAGRWNR